MQVDVVEQAIFCLAICQHQIFNMLSLPYIVPAAWQEFSGRDLHLLHVSSQVVGHALRQGAEAARHPLRQGAEGGGEGGGAFQKGKD